MKERENKREGTREEGIRERSVGLTFEHDGPVLFTSRMG
jgi:hypothetical protein